MVSSAGWVKTAGWGLALRVVGILGLSLFESVYRQELAGTDIDYKVYSDAALYASPYDRATYRYTPLLAYLNAFNYSLHETVGKLFFALFDVLAIYLLYAILSRHNNPQFQKTSLFNADLTAKLYSYNPLFIYLTVRGSCESITLALMYAFWYFFFGGEASGNQALVQPTTQQQPQPVPWKRYAAYAVFGLWVHVRVYPIVLVPLFFMHAYHSVRDDRFKNAVKSTVELGLVAGGVFLGLGLFFWALYGNKFVYETYLYHIWRRDNRHSFSAFFYEIYLSYTHESDSFSRSLIRTMPFVYILGTLVLRHVKTYSPFCIHFLITFCFVTFNKVITLQYYMWVLGSLLLVMPESLIFINKMYRKGLAIILQYFFPILMWIWLSLRLEGGGENNLHTMWLICLFQVYMHLWVVVSFLQTIKRYNPQ